MKNTVIMVCCAAALIGCKASEVKPGEVASASATPVEAVPSATASAVPSASTTVAPAVSAVTADKK